MDSINNFSDRRRFLKTSAIIAGGATLSFLPSTSHAGEVTKQDDTNIIGPKEGYTPQIGTLVSMMNWMRMVALSSVRNMTKEQLDYLHDPDANTIGAMLLHLAATETYYYLHTVEGMKWGSWDDAVKKKWDIAMNLGEPARKSIKGHSLDYYLTTLEETREKTLTAFRNRDDAWLLSVDKDWPWGPTNNYCKWFHVCEHESNHNGQVKWIKSRIPNK